MFRSHFGGVVPGHEVGDVALHVSASDGGKGLGQPLMRIDRIQFAGLNQRGDDSPVLGPRVVAGKEGVLPI